jgi:hypothetical protein
MKVPQYMLNVPLLTGADVISGRRFRIESLSGRLPPKEAEFKNRRKAACFWVCTGLDQKLICIRYGAIMRGAVLYRMGLNCVKDRLMRRNYGVVHQGKYKPGEHPEFLRAVNKAGMVVCNRAMEWCAYKVCHLNLFFLTTGSENAEWACCES